MASLGHGWWAFEETPEYRPNKAVGDEPLQAQSTGSQRVGGIIQNETSEEKRKF